MAEFGDVWGAANEGTTANENLFNNYIYNQAQNALVGAYGPMAGNPQGALQMQQFNYLGGMDPLLVQQQQQTNQLNAGLMQPRIQAGQAQANEATANAVVAADPTSIQGRINQNVGSGQNALGVGQTSLATGAQAGFMQHARAITAGLDTASQVLSNGGAPEDAYNQGIAAARMSGGANDSEVNQLATPQFKQAFMQNPQGMIDNLRRQAINGYGAQMGVLDPQTRASLFNSQQQYQDTHLKMVQSAQGMYHTALDKANGALEAQGPIGARMVQMNAANDYIDQMQGLIKNGVNPNAALRTAREKLVPGSPEAQYRELAENVGGALSLGTIQEAQETGKSLNLRNIREFQAAGNSVANFDENLTPSQSLNQLSHARALINQFQSAGNAQIAANAPQYRALVDDMQRQRQIYTNLRDATPGMQPFTPPGIQTPPAGAAPSAPAQAPAAGPGNQPSPQGAGPQPGPAAGQQSYNVDTPATRTLNQAGVDLGSLEQQHNLPQGTLGAIASIENPTGRNAARNPYTGDAGPFQFSPGTAAEYGVRNPDDAQQSALGAARYAERNQALLSKALGRPPTAGEIYLAHQQDAKGALDIIQHPSDPAVGARFSENGASPGMTKGQFGQMWINRANALTQSVPSQQVATNTPAPQGQGQPIRQPIPTNPGGPAPQPPGQPVYRPIAATPSANIRTAAVAPRRSVQVANNAPAPQAPASLQTNSAPPAQTSMLTAGLSQPQQAPSSAGMLGNVLAGGNAPMAAPTARPSAPATQRPGAIPIQPLRGASPMILAAGAPSSQGGEGNAQQRGGAAVGPQPAREGVLAGRALLAKYLRSA